MKPCYINSVASISAQNTFDTTHFLNDVTLQHSRTINAIPPNYKEFISPVLSRRMATGVKMGVTAAKMALREAQVKIPDAIITGTGMGCIEDSEKFLNAMINNDEQYLTPTSFIQSTHNTVGAQIALALQCKGYNVTYTHGAASFESALFDAQLMINEDEAATVLVGGVDELGKQFIKDIVLLEEASSQSIAIAFGEGAHFFTLSSVKHESSHAVLKATEIIQTASPTTVKQKLQTFLKHHKLKFSDIDAVVFGTNGDGYDSYYHSLQEACFKTTTQLQYKHLCGEFFTASAFGFWAASKIIKQQHIPECLKINNIQKSHYKTVLLYNQFKGKQHSFIILTLC